MYKKFIAGKPFVGRGDGLYATTKEAIDQLIAESGGDLAKVKKRLGIEPQYWNEPLWRVDIHNPLLHNARMPSGMEAGANPLFQWGGYTRGGMPEVVLDPVPNGAFGASPTGVKP
jgi:hypothetical protein